MKSLSPDIGAEMPGRALRILVIGSIPPYPGGAEISLGQLIGGFARKGHAVSCLSPASHQLAAACAEFDSRHPEFRIHRYAMPDLDYLPYQPNPEFSAHEKLGIEAQFPSIMQQFSPDLVISGRESYASVVIPLAQAAGLPCVQLLRGSPTAQIIAGTYPADLGQAFIRYLQSADEVIAVSEFMAGEIRKRGVSRAFCIPNAVDTGHFMPSGRDREILSDLDLPAGAPIVISPSNLLPRKRPLDLLRAAEIALLEEPSLQFVFLGDGTDAETFASAVRRSPARENLHLLGWRPYRDMPALLNAADLVVMTSESEGMSRSCIETLACGKLLIASDIPPARELIDDGRTGLLFPVGDCPALAERILWAVEHPAESVAMGQHARKAVLNRDYESTIDRYLSALRNVVDQRGRRRNTGSSSR